MRLQLPNKMYLYETSQRFCSVKAHESTLPISFVADHVNSVHLLFLVKEEHFILIFKYSLFCHQKFIYICCILMGT